MPRSQLLFPIDSTVSQHRMYRGTWSIRASKTTQLPSDELTIHYCAPCFPARQSTYRDNQLSKIAPFKEVRMLMFYCKSIVKPTASFRSMHRVFMSEGQIWLSASLLLSVTFPTWEGLVTRNQSIDELKSRNEHSSSSTRSALFPSPHQTKSQYGCA